MKNLISIASISIVFVCASFANTIPPVDSEKEIIAFIEEEYNAWASRDFEKWKAAWDQSDQVTHMYFSKTYHHEMKGWKALSEAIQEAMTTNPDPLDPWEKKNYKINISKNLATVELEAYNPKSDRGDFNKEFWVLEKQSGSWKAKSLIVTNTQSYTDHTQVEACINGDGYALMDAGKTEEAIKVFKLNTELYPSSGNVWDSLAEAYMESGENELAIAYYKKSLRIDPKNTNAEEMIKKIEANQIN